MQNNSKLYISNAGLKEKALLVLVVIKKYGKPGKEILNNQNNINKTGHIEEIEELKNLAISAGADVRGTILHNQKEVNSRYFISSGKLEEIKNFVINDKIDLVIFSNDLTANQQGNLEDRINLKVIDRTALILDIFAQRAHSREGKLQVELAQLNYMLPRLKGTGQQLSRLGGGIGTRGPGEQKLEVDRRKIRKRISQVEEKVRQIAVHRETQRKRREDKGIFLVSLVGYTNSGKSTVLNSLTNSDVVVKNMLFSTLDSTTRKLETNEIDEILLTDTVGFIEKLPHQLVMAFKSTLEEVRLSDLLLIIIDSSNKNYENHIKSVTKVLKEISVSHKPAIFVFNKIDKISKEKLGILRLRYRNGVFISALKKSGLNRLIEKIKQVKERNKFKIKVKIPYSESKLISFVYDHFEIINKEYMSDSVIFLLNADKGIYNRLSDYIYRDKKEISVKNDKMAI